MIQSYINVDGQLVSANYGDGKSEDFLWDGLALVKRGGEQYINEPHVGNAPQKLCFGGKPRAKRSARRARNGPRGNPVVSSKGTSYFNDMLGTTLGAKTKGKYSAAALTAFGEDLSSDTKGESSTHSTFSTLNSQFFTGKPHVAGLGHAFLFRNYRAGLGKWQTADPLGYPDGWNQLAYGINSPASGIDIFGASWGNIDFVNYYFNQDSTRPDCVDTDQMDLTDAVLPIIRRGANDQIDLEVQNLIKADGRDYGSDSYTKDIHFSVNCGSIVWAMGGGLGRASGMVTCQWGIKRYWYANHLYEKKWYYWYFEGSLVYSDEFKDPVDVLNIIPWDFEVPYGRPYNYGHTWSDQILNGEGYIWARMIE